MKYMTDFGVYRVPVQGTAEAEQVLERPVTYEDLTFSKDKMYFCGEDQLLYVANLDGKNKKRLVKEKAGFPQVYDGRIYYRNDEYDKNGWYELNLSLMSVSLDGTDKKKIIDEVYQFNVADGGIYYTEIPKADGDTKLHFYDLQTGEDREITDCQIAGVYIFEEADWIVIKKAEGELEPGEEGGKPTHLYCVKKDGSQCQRLEYPKELEE